MRLLRLSFLCLGSLTAALAQSPASTGTLGYKLVPEWPLMMKNAAGSPAPWNFIQVTAVAIHPSGRVFVLHRGAHPVMEFDASGKFLRSWGDGMFSDGKVAAIAPKDRVPGQSVYSAVYGPAGCASCGAHSVRVDPQGNLWLVDATGHIIYKMNLQGEVLLRLGRKGVQGNGQDTFNLPTDVGFAPNGDLYVSDGYGGARVVKYSREGKYLLEWGKRGKGPGEFELPHNVVVDAQGKVYVTDRENQRIQVFDANGKFLNEWTKTGGISTLFITKDQHIWAGGVLRDLNGKILGTLTGAPTGHGTAVSGTGDVYLAQLSGIVQKFVKP
jgi:DNA-binding beta-propeller fold protein YncE